MFSPPRVLLAVAKAKRSLGQPATKLASPPQARAAPPLQNSNAAAAVAARARPTSVHPRAAADNRVLSPMKAGVWQARRDNFSDTEPLFASPKLDGVRCLVAADRAGNPYAMSRTGTRLESCDRVTAALAPLFQRDPTLVLDGELYHHTLAYDFNLLVSAAKVSRAKASKEHLEVQALMQLHVFDVAYMRQLPLAAPFAVRKLQYELLLQSLGRAARAEKVVGVKHTLVRKPGVDKFFQACLADDYEGIMLRAGHAPYAHGARSNDLLKYKVMQDAEFRITEVAEGKGKLKGSAGAVWCLAPNGEEFKASCSVNEVERRLIWQCRQDFTGQMATVQFQQLTEYGTPRFPVFKAIRGAASETDWV
jgi:DNA ligase-1